MNHRDHRAFHGVHRDPAFDNELSEKIIGAAIRVHRSLGPGLLESAYKECLHYELWKAGVEAEKEKPMPLTYGTVRLDCGYRLDLFVAGKMVVEIKACEALNDIPLAQVLTYLKLTGTRLGLLINFNVTLLKDGIRRVVL